MTAARTLAALLAAAAVPLLALPPAAAAQTKLYTFTDEEGTVYYSNRPSDPRYEEAPNIEPPRRGGDDKSRPYEDMILAAAAKYDVDANLLRAVIKCESDFDSYAVSRAGAKGLMQLMPETAELVDVENRFDPRQSLEGGTRFLRHLLDTFGEDRTLALAAYNAGEGAVRRHGGVPPYRETKNYIRAVLKQYERYCVLGAEGDPITTADIRSFVNGEGTTLFTNRPWKYEGKRAGDWKKVVDP